MDMKHRLAYIKVSQIGVKEPIILNEGVPLAKLTLTLFPVFARLASRYEGINIEIRFAPIGQHSTELERGMVDLLSAIDLSAVETESDYITQLRLSNPNDPTSPNYDPLLREYNMCRLTTHRDRKTPSDLKILKDHVTQYYAGSPWWDGIHHW